MSGPAIGEPDPGRAAPARTGLGDAAGGILVLLALGLILRLIIAYLLPGSGFAGDLASFHFWADNLADLGIYGFYDRAAAPGGFFADYTPGYLYVLWVVGTVANLLGNGVGDLIKVPPILGDLALAYLVWSMTLELGGSKRAARLGAIIVILNPVTWFDSVVWGQVDSVGVVFLLLALRELWRDRPERSAILAVVAAIIKPQLAILIPLVAIVVIRRAFWPQGGYGAEGVPERRGTTVDWESRIRGPIRVVTTGAAGFLTAIALSLPFGLSIPGLVAQIFKTAAGYPYLTVNAFNPWALVVQTTTPGDDQSLALKKAWICDSTVAPAPAGDITIGDWHIWSWPASTHTCDPGLYIGAFPAVLVGAFLFLAAAAVILWFVGRRPDRITMLVGLALLALAFFVLPTRVHERYLFPFVAVAAILAAVSARWRLAYLLSGAAMFSNMYVILVNYYHENPNITDWLGQGETLASPWAVTIAALVQVAVLGWAFFQLREEATEDLAERFAVAGRDPIEAARRAGWLGRELPARDVDELDETGVPLVRPLVPWGERAVPRLAAALTGGRLAMAAATAPGRNVVTPAWDLDRDSGALGPIEWFRARLRDTPVRADRSRLLNHEGGGRLDRLDVWVLVLLAISLMTVRMWRLDEPYQVHFDEVYHPRTATEFLEDWRYGIEAPEIYEWTHPHMAKYAMALGLVALGEDRVDATSQLGVAVVDAAVEPRRDQTLDETQVQGDRLWIATGSEVRAYDLSTRRLAGTMDLPGAVAFAYDRNGQALYVGTRSGEIRIIDTGVLDATRRGPPVEVSSRAYMSLDGPIDHMYISRSGDRLAVVLAAGVGTTDPNMSQVVVIDAAAAVELGRPAFHGVGQLTMGVSDDRIAVATSNGVAFIETVAATVTDTLDLGGPVKGLAGINDIENDPIYATADTADGPRVSVIIAKTGSAPTVDKTLVLPDASAGRVYYDLTTRMVHIEGSHRDRGGQPEDTVYVLEPHGNAIYADAPLGFVPQVMVMDENQLYPSSDREQLLAIDAGGSMASVPIGRHAYAWRVPGVVAGVLMALFLYVLARLLFKRRTVAVILAVVVLVDGMLFAQSRIGMNDSYVGLGIVAAYTIFAALWLRPGNSRRHWIAFVLGVPLMGFFLGFALASKWVAAYAMGGIGILALVRSALGRLVLIAGLIVATTALGYVAISVPAGTSGGNYLFFLIMVGFVVAAVIANTLHPIAWTTEEQWFAVGAPSAAGLLMVLYGLSRGDATVPLAIGPLSVTPIQLGLAGLLVGAGVYVTFMVVGRFGFGPMALPPLPDDPAAVLEPPAEAPVGWLRIGAGWGLPAIWLVVGLLVIPLGLYVISYIPWAMVEGHQIWAGATPGTGWPPGHTGQTLLELTDRMYTYHNTLSSAHPASSPWWAWAFDLKPVWFYEEGFAGRTSASIYDAGNLVAWWLAVPAMAFVVWQAFRRRSAALALVAIAFACQWVSWGRIDRAAFQYHYYTALPFLFLALAYFLAELWHGTSRRVWLLARLSGAVMVLGPFGLWLLHRPLCAIARVNEIVTDSQACPTLIPDVTITPRAVAIAVVVGVGVLLLVRELLSIADPEDPDAFDPPTTGWRGALARIGLGSRWAAAAVIAVGTSIVFVVVTTVLKDGDGPELTNIPVEPIALFVTIALSPVAAYVATARDSRRFVLGALTAMVFWFILWYPNISGLPLPSALHNAYQGFLPTYLYPFQFWVLQGTRPAAPSLFDTGPALVLLLLAVMAVVIAYSAWSWRIALAERRRDRLAGADEAELRAGADS